MWERKCLRIWDYYYEVNGSASVDIEQGISYNYQSIGHLRHILDKDSVVQEKTYSTIKVFVIVVTLVRK